MGYEILQMFLRGAVLIMMLIAYFLNSESLNLLAISQFVKTGVYGSYAIITLGLLCEAGFRIHSDVCVEASFLLGGVLFNTLCAAIAFIDFEKFSIGEKLDMALLSILSSIVFIIDFLFLLFT